MKRAAMALGRSLFALAAGCAREAPRHDAAFSPNAASPAASDTLAAVDPGDLVLMAGSIAKEGPTRFAIRDEGVRAQLGTAPRKAAEIGFTYAGPARREAPLASGELRRQIGLKLRARDTCNVVYVMWHIEPSQGIEVSVKANAGQTTHEQCQDRGYSFLHAESAHAPPAIRAGEWHTLRATIDGEGLEVLADGAPAWAGKLPAQAFAFDGPVGVRSDNGEFHVELRAAPARP